MHTQTEINEAYTRLNNELTQIKARELALREKVTQYAQTLNLTVDKELEANVNRLIADCKVEEETLMGELSVLLDEIATL